MRKFHGSKEFSFQITITVEGAARLYVDEAGNRDAEIEYYNDDKELEKQLDELLIKKLEKYVGFKNFRRKDGKLLTGGHLLIGFICSMRDHEYGWRK